MKKIVLIAMTLMLVVSGCKSDDKIVEEKVEKNCNIVNQDFTYTQGQEQEYLNNMLDFYVKAEETSQVYYSTYEGVIVEDENLTTMATSKYNLEECVTIGFVLKSDELLKTPEEENANSIYYRAYDGNTVAYSTSFDENYTISFTGIYEDTDKFEDAYESNQLDNTMPYLDQLIEQVKNTDSGNVIFISDYVYFEGEVELEGYGKVTASVFASVTGDRLLFRVDKYANSDDEVLSNLEIPTGDAYSVYFGEFDNYYQIYHQINLATSQVEE